MPVQIVKGKHSHQIPRGAEKLIERKLFEAGLPISQHWSVRLGPQIKGRNTMCEFKPLKPSERGGVSVRIKPGGNDTVYICYVIPPAGFRQDRVFRVLRNPPAPKPPKQVPREPILPPVAQTGEEMVGKNGDSGTKEYTTPQPINLIGFLDDKNNLQMALLAIKEISPNLETDLPVLKAREALLGLIGQDAKPHALGQLLRGLINRGLLVGLRRKAGTLKAIRFSDEALKVIGEDVPIKPSAPENEASSGSDANVRLGIKNKLSWIDARISKMDSEFEHLKQRKHKLECQKRDLQKALEALDELGSLED